MGLLDTVVLPKLNGEYEAKIKSYEEITFDLSDATISDYDSIVNFLSFFSSQLLVFQLVSSFWEYKLLQKIRESKLLSFTLTFFANSATFILPKFYSPKFFNI